MQGKVPGIGPGQKGFSKRADGTARVGGGGSGMAPLSRARRRNRPNPSIAPKFGSVFYTISTTLTEHVWGGRDD